MYVAKICLNSVPGGAESQSGLTSQSSEARKVTLKFGNCMKNQPTIFS